MRFSKGGFLALIALTIATSVTWAQSGGAENSVPAHKTPGFGVLGWLITPGIGVRLLDIDVTSKSTGAEGRVTNDGSFSNPIYLSLDIESPTLTLGKFGATVRAHTTSLKLDNQRFTEGGQTESDNIHDVDTEVKARYHYLMPTLFYRWASEGTDSRLGMGYGKWDASFSGDVLLSRDYSDAGAIAPTPVNGSVDGRKGILLFWQTRFRSGLFEISINEVDFSNSDFEFGMSELNMMYGYYFEL